MERRLNSKDYSEALIVKAYAPRIFSISVATGNDFRSKSASNFSIVKLSHDCLGISESVNNKAFIDSETSELLRSLRESEVISVSFDEKHNEIAHAIVGGLFLQRTFISQWYPSSYSIHHIPRLWRVFQLLDANLNGEATKIARKIFGMDPIHAIRSAFGIFTLFQTNNIGWLPLTQKSCDSEMIHKLNINMETLELIAQKISADSSRYKNWHKEVEEIPKPYRKYFPLPLFESPLYFEKKGEYFCPSPDIFIASSSEMIFREFRSNTSMFTGLNINVEIGNAFHEYVKETLPKLFPSAKIEDLSNEKHSGKFADFTVETEGDILVIEAKRSIGDAKTRTICSPRDIVGLWERIYKSLQQCSETIKELREKGKIGTKTILPFVVVESSILGEAELFLFYAFHCGILKGLGLDTLEILSIEQFERLVFSISLGEIKTEILEKWSRINENPALNSFYFIRQKNGNVELPFLDLFFKELFSQ